MFINTIFSNSGKCGAALLLLPALPALMWAQEPAANLAVPTRAATVQHSVRAGLETGLTQQTTPNATCTFGPEDNTNPRLHLRLDADADGFVRIHAKAQSASASAVPMLLDCTAQTGERTLYPVAVRAQAPGMKLPAPEARPVTHGMVRPALGPEAESMTSSELVARGYPPRPDPLQAPAKYAQWQKLTSRPFTAVDPRRVAHPEMKHSPTLPLPPPQMRFGSSLSFSNWSGAYLTNPDVKYWDVQADWAVPSAGSVPWWIGYAAAAEWVGLDNAGNDLLQSGTDSEAFDYNFFGQDWTFTNYSVWIESLPYAPYYLPNFPVSPGDEISVSIFLADQYGSTTFYYGDLTPSDDTVWFMIYNLTSGNSYWGTLPKPDAFTGSTVDFIVEAPSVNGSTTRLADFGIAGMHDCYFADSWFGFSSLDYNGTDPNVGTLYDVTMVDFSTGNTLASSYIYPNYYSSGGGNVLWVWQNFF